MVEHSIEKSLAKRRQELRVLEALSSLSYRTGELETYLQSIVHDVNGLLGLDWSVVTLCQNGTERILASSCDEEAMVNDVYALHGTLTEVVAESGVPLVVEDVLLNPTLGEAPDGYRAYLGVPLRTSSGAVIGTICSFNKEPRRFTAETVQLAKLFAERAATAIDNYHLYQQQQRFNQVLEAEVVRQTQRLRMTQARLIAMNNHLEQRIEQRTAELQQINQQLQTEIRERQQIEEALRQSEIRFRTLVENAADAFLLVDTTNGQIIDVNQSACLALGYTYIELLTRPLADIDATLSPTELTAFLQQRVFGVPATLESKYRRSDGTTFPVEANVCVFESGGRSLALALVRDITERKRAEHAMARLAEIGELAAMIVHEVRNPLTTVLMGLISLKGVQLPEKAQVRLALALEDAERLQRLLNEILLYTRQQTLTCSRLEINALVDDIVDSIRSIPAAEGREIQIVSTMPSAWVLGDRDKLRQVFINLIRNACEAVEPGAVIIWQIAPGLEPGWVTIGVHNNGNPIPPELLVKLGTPFFTTKPSGNGLGLAIVRRIVEAHNGQLSIHSAPNLGTTISVQIPLIRLEA